MPTCEEVRHDVFLSFAAMHDAVQCSLQLLFSMYVCKLDPQSAGDVSSNNGPKHCPLVTFAKGVPEAHVARLLGRLRSLCTYFTQRPSRIAMRRPRMMCMHFGVHAPAMPYT